MAAVYVSNLVINAGATFSQQFDLAQSDDSSPLDLTGYTIAAQIRKHAGSSNSVAFTATAMDAVNGLVLISLTPVQTASLKTGRHVYDIVITDSAGDKTRVVEGSVLVREGVTR
tara:strand:- start:5193 stop:5534 length:342 start_codon:yes stop_codon:yes gene_type:complete